MNKILFTAAVLTTSPGLFVLAPVAVAADGTINITGSLSPTTCAIGQKTQTVSLPTVNISSFNGAKSVAGETFSQISLVNCDDKTLLKSVYFEPGPTILSDGNLKNTTTDSSGATGVELQLLDSGHGVVDLTKPGSFNWGINGYHGNSSNFLTFYTQYYAANGAVTPGKVTSTVQFSMEYQ